jgi:hypothetical protein
MKNKRPVGDQEPAVVNGGDARSIVHKAPCPLFFLHLERQMHMNLIHHHPSFECFDADLVFQLTRNLSWSASINDLFFKISFVKMIRTPASPLGQISTSKRKSLVLFIKKSYRRICLYLRKISCLFFQLLDQCRGAIAKHKLFTFFG